MLLVEYLEKARAEKLPTIQLFCDIETYQYNEKVGYKHPSEFKNQVFSLAVAYIYDLKIYYEIYPNFPEFFETIENAHLSRRTKIELWFHNGNKYDNHYILYQLLHAYPDIPRYPRYVRQAEDNSFTETFKSLGLHKGDKVILEKRVKSRVNLDLEFTLGSVTYQTVDSLPKMGASNSSIKALGKTMNKLGLLDSKYLKTEMDYHKYSLPQDLTYAESFNRAYEIYKNLDSSENTYIANDVIILASAVLNYTKIFPGFDINKITFSQNILEEYKTNPLAVFQLTSKFHSLHFKYTDYDFRDINLYDYLKHFYKGGLNIYNDKYIGKIINHTVKSRDRNSSYPDVMYNDKVPTYLIESNSTPQETLLPSFNSDYFYMYEISVSEFNRLLSSIPSHMIRKSLVKYYANLYENYYISSITINLINLFSSSPITSLSTISSLKWQTEYFGARDVLADNYFKKTQGKALNKLIMHSPSNFEVTDQPNPYVFEPSEISTAKVINNGIYGLPALRAYYNMFKYNPHNNTLESLPSSFRNTERNMIFSIFVTSMAFYKLLEPLQYLTPDEIDQYWYYADTDSIWLDSTVADKIPDFFMNDLNLGKFKTDHVASQFYILNHKKYAYVDANTGEIITRSGGIPAKTFDLNQSFESFISSQFSPGTTITNTKSILTNVGTLAIYESETNLEAGVRYPETASEIHKEILREIAKNAQEEISENDSDGLYIETPFGVISVSETTKKDFDKANRDISNLIQMHKLARGDLPTYGMIELSKKNKR